MSQYEYYEFQAVDHRLSELQMQELRACSSRAQITPTSFINEYHFGSFKGDADLWMERYFDGFMYNSNWGTRILMLALPTKVLSAAEAQPCCQSSTTSAREGNGKTILKFMWHDENYENWIESHESLTPLLPLRDELARGDRRSLYIGWLLSVQSGKCEAGKTEPPVPANLGELSGALAKLIDFLRIDRDLLGAAAQTSPTVKTDLLERNTLAAWVESLPTPEKDELLVQFMEGPAAATAMELRARFNRSKNLNRSSNQGLHRTVGELLRTAVQLRETRRQQEARAAEAEKHRQQELAAQARKAHLESLVGREAELWAKVNELIALRQAKGYEEALGHLVDLRELATEQTSRAAFQARLAALRNVHAAKKSLLDRLLRQGF